MYRASFKYGLQPCRSSSKKGSFFLSAIRIYLYTIFPAARI